MLEAESPSESAGEAALTRSPISPTAVDAARPQTKKDPLFTRAFLLASVAHFLHALAFNLYLHLSAFLKSIGAHEVTIGLIVGATGAAAILSRPPMGRVMDRRGRRPMILAGGLLHAGVCLLYLTVSEVGAWVAVVRIIHGLSEAALFASLFAYASDIVPASRRFEGIALFGVSGMLPISLGSALGDVLKAHGGYQPLFVVAAGLAFAGFLLSLPLRDAHAPSAGDPPRGMRAAFLQRNLLPLWLAGVVFATCIAAPFSFFATFVMEIGAGSTGLFFTCYAGAAITLRVLAGRLPERVGPKRVLLPAMVSVALGLALLIGARTDGLIGLAGILAGSGHGYTFPILLGLVVSRARTSERGAALSIFTALFDAGSLMGGPLFGAIVRASGYTFMFATAAVMMVIGTCTFAFVDRKNTVL